MTTATTAPLRRDMELLRAKNAALRADQVSRDESQTRLKTENTMLWAQVLDHRRRIEELSTQLRHAQEAMRTGGIAAMKTVPSVCPTPPAHDITSSTVLGPSFAHSQPLLTKYGTANDLVVASVMAASATTSGVGDLWPASTLPERIRMAALSAQTGQVDETDVKGMYHEKVATMKQGATEENLEKDVLNGSDAERVVQSDHDGACSFRGSAPTNGGAEDVEGTLTCRLATLKAHMAAVEAQGETLRSATRAVEDEYRRVSNPSETDGLCQ